LRRMACSPTQKDWIHLPAWPLCHNTQLDFTFFLQAATAGSNAQRVMALSPQVVRPVSRYECLPRDATRSSARLHRPTSPNGQTKRSWHTFTVASFDPVTCRKDDIPTFPWPIPLQKVTLSHFDLCPPQIHKASFILFWSSRKGHHFLRPEDISPFFFL
jgi:hypothetical protein